MFLQAQQLSYDILYHSVELNLVIDCGKSVINQFKFPTIVISVGEKAWMGTLELQSPS